jgi:hypothetical protein
MIAECPRCESHVDAKVLGTHDLEDVDSTPWRLTLAACPLCGQPLLVSQEMVAAADGEEQWSWSPPAPLWPTPELQPNPEVPDPVRECLDEAQKCFKAKAHFACGVMIGRALEAVCADQIGEPTSLVRGLRTLRDRGIIDGRLHAWSESLREQGHLDARSSTATADDAKDLIEFAMVVCEYVYGLSRKYARYQERRGLSPRIVAVPPPLPLPLPVRVQREEEGDREGTEETAEVSPPPSETAPRGDDDPSLLSSPA